MSLTQLAQDLEISRPTLNKYRREGCPVDDVAAARLWIGERKASDGRGGKRNRAAAGGSFLDLREQLQRASIRKTQAEAQLREFEASIAQKNLVSMDEAKAYLAEVLAPLRVLLDSLPKACAVKCNPSDPQLAEDGIREAVDGLFKLMDRAREDGANGA